VDHTPYAVQYRDFSILLEPEGGRLLARVVDSPAGSTRAYVDLAEFVGSDSLFDSEAERRALGSALFDRLFAGQIRGCWDHSVGQLTAQESVALRLRLHFNLDEPGSLALHALPWECLYSSAGRNYLALSRRTSVVRDVSLPIPSARPLFQPPLRVLLIGASPRDLRPLEVVTEGLSIARAIQETDRVRVSLLKRADLESLRQQLLEDDIHIVHFMGHSQLSATSGQGMVFLQDEHGAAVAVPGTQLASHLRDCRALRLVFLNSCKSACLSPTGPFLGLASAILNAEVPAVIAMQSPVSDPAAMAFSRIFYRRLAAGDPIDAAMTEGRLAIQRERGCEGEWTTPSLFLRSPDGQLFAPAQRPLVAPGPTAPLAEPVVAEAALRNERRPRTGRPWRAPAVLSAGIVMAFVLARWAGPQGGSPESPPFSSTAEIQQATSDLPTPTETQAPSSTTSSVPRQPEPTDRKGKGGTGTTGHPASEPPREPRVTAEEKEAEPAKEEPVEAPPDFYWLGEFDSATWAQQSAQLSARFSEVAGMGLVEISVALRGSPALRLPFTTTESASREGPGGTYRVEVLQIDWPRKRVKVRPLFVPS
jgi:hypothetical protein